MVFSHCGILEYSRERIHEQLSLSKRNEISLCGKIVITRQEGAPKNIVSNWSGKLGLMAEWEGYHRFPASYVVRAYLNSTPTPPTTTKHTKTSESGQGVIRQSFSPSTLEAGVWGSEVQGQPVLHRSCFKNLRRGTREMTWHLLLLQRTQVQCPASVSSS